MGARKSGQRGCKSVIAKGLAWREGVEEGLAAEVTCERLSYRYTGCQALSLGSHKCRLLKRLQPRRVRRTKSQKPHPSPSACRDAAPEVHPSATRPRQARRYKRKEERPGNGFVEASSSRHSFWRGRRIGTACPTFTERQIGLDLSLMWGDTPIS